MLDGVLQWPVGFLWYNAIGCVGVVLIGIGLSWRR
jgi:hypothetical protein